MRILFLEWNGYGNEDMKHLFESRGYSITTIDYDIKMIDAEVFRKKLHTALQKGSCDFLFSFNYYPIVSECCNEQGLKYVSWVYDSPYIYLYSYTVPNSCNFIFVFDYNTYAEFKAANINTIYYLPLAVYKRRMKGLKNTEFMRKKHTCETSFVGSMYSEKKHRLYQKFSEIDDFSKGYLDGIIRAQGMVYGYNFLQEVIPDSVLEQMQKIYPCNPNDQTVATPEYIYSDYVLSRQVTAVERKDIIELVSDKFQTNLYTNDCEISVGKSRNMGKIDYYDEMPFVFMNSKINLNITLKSIRTGIPLRAMDIMGCGGFMISNYQQELLEYFEPDEELVYYTNYEELLEKIEFYLRNDSLREKIAQSACLNVLENHTYEKRLDEILNVIG